MQVEVQLRGSLRRHRPADIAGAPHQPFTLDLPPNSTVAALFTLMELPVGRVSAAAVNGEAVEEDRVLQAGDQIVLFPPVAGGQGSQDRL